MTAIELKDITYTYPLAKTPALRNISAVFEEGYLYGIIGQNGSGKTTLCNLIRCFVPNFYHGILKGTVVINGQPFDDIDYDELSLKVGYIFQNPFTQISGIKETVFEEIAMGLENLGTPRDEIIERTMTIVRRLGIENLVKNNPNYLSGGQKQRVAFASIVVMDPPIIVIDEPTSQLDPQGTEMIFDIIKTLKEQGKTILLVEHKVELLAEYADEILVMNKGTIITSGKTGDILSNIQLVEKGVNIPQVAILASELQEDGLRPDYIPVKLSDATKVICSLSRG
jgi:energy-coupling factor transport system ATP-binding protein